jgi:glyoxylase-like metal-dependent hydrolase (beta-lactamase superfamily II)
MSAYSLPPQLHVFVRDWLSSNNVVLKSRDGHVVIDTGYVRHAPLTVALIGSPRGIGSDPLAWIVNTHCHSDHIGGNAAIVAKYGCPIAVPEGEAPLVERWDQKALLYDYCDQRAGGSSAAKACSPARRTSGVISSGVRSRPPGTTWARSCFTTPSMAFSFRATRCGRTVSDS